MYKIKCAEIWGGIKNAELDVCSAGITASLFSSSCDGGKGGDAEPMQIKSHILAALRDWTGGPLVHDDVTLIAVQLA